MTRRTLSIHLSKCSRCGACEAMPLQVCRHCLSTNFSSIEVPARGKVVSTTVIRRPPAHLREQGTYGVVSLLLDDGPQLTGLLRETDLDCAPGDHVYSASKRGEVYIFEKETQ